LGGITSTIGEATMRTEDLQRAYEADLSAALAQGGALAKAWQEPRWTLPAITSDGLHTEFRVSGVKISPKWDPDRVEFEGVYFHPWLKEFQRGSTGFTPSWGVIPLAQIRMMRLKFAQSSKPTLESVITLMREIAQDEELSEKDRRSVARAIRAATQWKQAA
jgi:hypothetical protein